MERIFLPLLVFSVLLLALVPQASAAPCGVYIYNLDANENGFITFIINNTGESTEDISYKVFIGMNEISSVEDLELSAGEAYDGIAGYNFLYGNYRIRVEAYSDCGSWDFEEMVYAILEPLPNVCSGPEGVEGDTICDGDAGFVLECRDGRWIYHGEDESCSRRCHPYCEGEKIMPKCKVDIESLDFLDNIIEGNPLKLEAGIRNTGRGDEIINLKLYINEKLRRDYLLAALGPDESIIRTFYYYPGAGENEFRLEAIANCSASDSKTETFLVIAAPPEPEPEPEPEPAQLVTQVTLSPKSLDIPLFKAKTLELDIESSRLQEFNITVTGAEEDWLQYTARLDIEGRDQVYIYITPQELGTYNLTVRVQGEVQTFQEQAGFYVVPTGGGEPGDWLSTFLFRNWLLILLITGIVILILVLAFGIRYWSARGRI